MRKIVFLVFTVCSTWHLSAQINYENSPAKFLKVLLDSTRKVTDDSLRNKLNLEFSDALFSYVSSIKILNKSLDSLKISNVVSVDGNLHFLSWNIQQNNGANFYGGIVINKVSGKVIRLKIKPSEPSIPDNKIYREGDWPGGIVYRIIQRKFESKTNYTILSWDGFNHQTSRKSIESLSFDDKGNAVFGAPVFKVREGIKNRIVYEYSSNATFSMQYNRQKVTLTGVRKSQREVNDEMIILDRLVPLNEEMKNQRWAYVPAGNTHDAFIYFEGFWTLTEDILARNEAPPKSETKKQKTVELDLFPDKNK